MAGMKAASWLKGVVAFWSLAPRPGSGLLRTAISIQILARSFFFVNDGSSDAFINFQSLLDVKDNCITALSHLTLVPAPPSPGLTRSR
jgi:hypothetical protein